MDGMEITQFTYFQQVDLTLLHDFCSNHTGTTQLFGVHILDVAKECKLDQYTVTR
jgi:glycyl-tRNA synthetase alpha subunit